MTKGAQQGDHEAPRELRSSRTTVSTVVPSTRRQCRSNYPTSDTCQTERQICQGLASCKPALLLRRNVIDPIVDVVRVRVIKTLISDLPGASLAYIRV